MSTTSKEEIARFPTEQRARDWASGFLLLGVLVGLLGSLPIAWQYHLNTEPELIGLHFLAFAGGYVLAGWAGPKWLARVPMRTVAMIACLVASGGLVSLSFLVPPIPSGWRIGGLAVVGFGAGAVATSLLHVLERWFARFPAQAINTAGALFGAGCALATVVVAATYFTGSVQIETGVLAIVPLIFLALFASSRFRLARQPFPIRVEEEKRLKALHDLRSNAAVLFSLLLFFQSGNEFVIGGWLPIFLVHRLGANPVLAILALATYFSALTLGRLAARGLLRRWSHRKMLFGSVTVAMAGYLLLSFAPTMAWVWPATVIVGLGFAPIYPLLTEILDHRFSYHPGFYNGIFSVAVIGAAFLPWLIGYVDRYWGVQYILTIPAFGSVAVAILVLLIMFEARLMGSSKEEPARSKGAAAGG